MGNPFTEDEETDTEKEELQINTISTTIMNKINNEEDILDNLPLTDINDITKNIPTYETYKEFTQQFNLHYLRNETQEKFTNILLQMKKAFAQDET